MARLDLKLIPVTPFQQNCSLLYDVDTKQGVLIDPGGEAQRLRGVLDEMGITLVEMWLTHGHLDHAGGADELREQLGVKVIGPHKDDQFWMDDIGNHWAKYGHPGMGRAVVPDRYLEDGDVLELSGVRFEVLHTPGHTPGHVVIANREMKIVFVGDVLFPRLNRADGFSKGQSPAIAGFDHLQALAVGQRDAVRAGPRSDGYVRRGAAEQSICR